MAHGDETTSDQVVRADAMQRAKRAWQMRIEGHGWDVIADETGFSHGTNAARAAKRYAGDLPSPDRDAMRQLIRERAEWLWREVRSDIEDRRPGATRAGVALLQRMSAFEGADEPTRVQVSPDQESFFRMLDQLVLASGVATVEEGDVFGGQDEGGVVEGDEGPVAD